PSAQHGYSQPPAIHSNKSRLPTVNHLGASMKLGLILGDQLSPDLATLRALDKSRDVLLMAEVPAEATYVRHHQQKIAFIFSAMRHFAADLEQAGWRVHYLRYGEHNFDSLHDALLAYCDDAEEVIVTHCGEYRL